MHNTKSIKIKNLLQAEALIELKIDEKKTNLHLKDDEGIVNFKAKSEYKESYQMIEKYKRILVKLSYIHPQFSAQSIYFLIYLHSRSFFYQSVIFFDQNGD